MFLLLGISHNLEGKNQIQNKHDFSNPWTNISLFFLITVPWYIKNKIIRNSFHPSTNAIGCHSVCQFVWLLVPNAEPLELKYSGKILLGAGWYRLKNVDSYTRSMKIRKKSCWLYHYCTKDIFCIIPLCNLLDKNICITMIEWNERFQVRVQLGKAIACHYIFARRRSE